MDRKTENMERKEEHLSNRLARLEATQAEAERLKQEQVDVLEKISGFTAEEAKAYLLSQLEADVTHESAMKIKEIEARFKDEADSKAREIISLAIQRCAADHVAEATVSVVPLPNDEMKGRIIGREGRNIRTLETLTGVDLIIDDTPEAITVSCFDPVRREIARLALEKLILDGRIHPARIEEMVEKAKREVDATIKAEGERAIFETNVHGLHPELVKLLGRMRYRTSYGQNVLNHSIEVSHIAGLLAAEIGANVTEAKRAGLLHDLGKSIDHEVEGSHVTIGVELARKYHESEAVIHAIHAHHNDVEPQTVVACLVQAADAISAARPGARRENLENYIKRLEKLEEITSSFPGQEDRGRAGVPRPDQGQPSAGDQGHRVRQIRQIWSVSKRLPKQLPCRNAAGKLFCLSENQRGIRWLHPRTGFRVSAALCNYESHVLQISASKAAARSVAMIEAFLSF